MAQRIQAGQLRERVDILSLAAVSDREDQFLPVRTTWAKVDYDDRRVIFADNGVGVRGVILTLRQRPITLADAVSWRGQHGFLTEITPDPASPGYLRVRAALVEPRRCTLHGQIRTTRGELNRPVVEQLPERSFPGFLAEQYRRSQEEDISRTETRAVVLVTPKGTRLRPGDLVSVGTEMEETRPWTVRTVQDLGPWHNEYLIEREADV